MEKNDMLRSKYTSAYTIKDAELRNAKLLYFLMAILFITNWVMPPYLGFHIGFDFTCTRLLNMLIVVYFILNPKVGNHFLRSISEVQLTPYLVLYMLVMAYTMVFRTNVNTFFLNFLDILTFYMIYYGIRYVIGIKKAINWSVNAAWFLGVYGVIEYLLGYSPMLRFLMTLPTPVKEITRSGQYRIMGPCAHSIAYGMLLLFLIAVVCIDLEKDEMYLFKNPLLYALLMINIFLTGSRGPLGIAFVETALIIIFSNKRNRQKTIMILVVFLLCFCVIEAAIYNTSMGRYIMMQITSVIDEAFGTNYAVNFGADSVLLGQSSNYRDYLPRIFTVEWLNPLLGTGVSSSAGFQFDGVFIRSIDNFYVALFIRYAYPGLVTYVLFFIMTAFHMLKIGFQKNSGICKALAISVIMYYIALWWVDYLMTTKYLYIIVAFYAVYYSERCSKKAKINEK